MPPEADLGDLKLCEGARLRRLPLISLGRPAHRNYVTQVAPPLPSASAHYRAAMVRAATRTFPQHGGMFEQLRAETMLYGVFAALEIG